MFNERIHTHAASEECMQAFLLRAQGVFKHLCWCKIIFAHPCSSNDVLFQDSREALGVISRPVESKTRTHHGRIGSGRRTAGRWSGAGPGRTGRRRIGSPRKQPTLVLPKASKIPVINVSLEALTKEIPCKPMEKQKPRLTGGLLAGRDALFVPGC